jgi:hypothetical protein
MSETLKARVRTRICLWDTGWRVAHASDLGEHVRDVEVRDVEVSLEIQGDEGQGYCLVMSPEGAFTADDWYATREEALRAACELFGVPVDAWRP